MDGASKLRLFMKREGVTGCKLPYVPIAAEFHTGAAWLNRFSRS